MSLSDLQQAARLLHIVRAWYWKSSQEPDSARADSLYPARGISSDKKPLFAAINDLLERHPYGGASEPPSELPLARNCLSNLVAAVERFGPIDADIDFAMREARQLLGGMHTAVTKSEPPDEREDPCHPAYVGPVETSAAKDTATQQSSEPPGVPAHIEMLSKGAAHPDTERLDWLIRDYRGIDLYHTLDGQVSVGCKDLTAIRSAIDNMIAKDRSGLAGETSHAQSQPRGDLTVAPHQERVVTEKAELDEKLAKLTAFTTMQNATFAGLPQAEQGRLIRQRGIMEQYSAVLAERIAAF